MVPLTNHESQPGILVLALFSSRSRLRRHEGCVPRRCFLKGGIDKNQQTGFLSLERLNKLQTIASTEAQSCDQQLRLGFRDLIECIANVVCLAAYLQVRLSIQEIGHPVAKQRMFFQD